MRRRDFIKVIAGSATVWPLAARAQQPERMRRIGVLMNVAAGDSQGQARLAAFQQVLQQLGWSGDRKMHIDVRWGENDIDLNRKYAAELVALAPDVMLTSGTPSTAALRHVTRTLPIVFVLVSDPVGAGLVESLARPGDNVTGFMLSEYSLSGKWLELLKEVMPRLTQALILRDPTNPAASAQFGALQALAPSLGVELRPVDTRDVGEIERTVRGFEGSSSSGLVVTPSASESTNHGLIIKLAASYKLPAIYTNRNSVAAGGLISYGPDWLEQYRRAAGYVDRILKGEKPGDLPVQAPTKYELVINLKTAKALGLDVPSSLLARADEVIE
jgi:putative ABC transport system substrate-binding protein